ncbi:MAG: hypothetical protein INR69_19585 [Mucilaginibacter polytrichastri]|nr:hypothetical protein [Mucilaginibacter polytrichastri]
MKLRTTALLLVWLFAACQPSPEKTPAKEAKSKPDSVTAAISDDSTAPTVKVDTFKNIPQNKLVIPGERVGETYIDEPGTELFASKNKPDAGDSAMGKSWSTWYSKPAPGDIDTTRNELNVFTSRRNGVDGDVAKVKMIRITSPFFATKTKVSARKSFEYIKAVFPGVKKVAFFPDKGKEVSIYDDVQNGIAFEFSGNENSSVCKAVIVHEKGQTVLDAIAGLHTGIKKI